MKEKARAMIRMTRDINEKHLAPLGASVSVACVTCHHGQTQPRLLQACSLE